MTTTPVKQQLRTPPHVVAYRAVTVAITVLLLLLVGFGLAGHGPLSFMNGFARPVTHAFDPNGTQG
ncbi:MAG: hypothetical protein ACRDNF_09370 [Streptosporangiaceae bacterium]